MKHCVGESDTIFFTQTYMSLIKISCVFALQLFASVHFVKKRSDLRSGGDGLLLSHRIVSSAVSSPPVGNLSSYCVSVCGIC